MWASVSHRDSFNVLKKWISPKVRDVTGVNMFHLHWKVHFGIENVGLISEGGLTSKYKKKKWF